MNIRFSRIESKLFALEIRVQSLEANEHKQPIYCSSILQDSKEKQTTIVQGMNIKYVTIDALPTQIEQMEHSPSQ